MNGAGMMAELNPVPLAAMPLTVERAQASDGADGVEAGFSRLSAFVTNPKWTVAKLGGWREASTDADPAGTPRRE